MTECCGKSKFAGQPASQFVMGRLELEFGGEKKSNLTKLIYKII